MDFNTDLNYIGIIAATIVAFVIGAAWYSPIPLRQAVDA